MEPRTRVLIVDNDPTVVRTLRAGFEADGFEVVTAASGSGAMCAIRAARPDVIVLEVAMPECDGWFVLAELAGVLGAPPVIVTARNATALDIARAHALGACEHVFKPRDPALLVGKARRASEQYAVIA